MVVQKLLIRSDKTGPFFILTETGLYSEGEEPLWVLPADKKSTMLGASAFSPDGSLLVLCDSLKSLYLFSINDDRGAVILLNECRSEKCPTSICFESNQSLIVADRFGDVTRYGIQDGKFSADPRVILGHVSIITDMIYGKAMAADGSDLIVTADRDEKIRLTRAAEPHLIEAFLLSHTEYVSAVKRLGLSSLLSVSGDGTLKLWETTSGALKATLDLAQHVSGRQVQVEKIVSGKADGEDEEEAVEEEVEIVDKVIVEPLDMDISVDGNQLAIIFDQSNEIALINLPELTFDRLVKLPEGHQVICMAYHPPSLRVVSFEPTSGHSHLFTVNDSDLTSRRLGLEGRLDLEKAIWKGGMRKDCHGLFAKRLLKRKLAAAKGQDEPSDIDEE